MLAWTPGDLTESELWEKWLHSEAVRAFESGTIDSDAFADHVIDEFDLSISPSEFITAFETWADSLFDGVEDLLDSLRGSYRLATMSNTNAIHWPKLTEEMKLGALIETHFPSHQSGLLKPDAEAFDHVIRQLAIAPEQILFFDDNEINVTAAHRSGLQAEIAKGPADIRSHLIHRGLL